MKKSEFEKKNDQELQEMLVEKREALREFRFGIAGSRVRDVREGRKHRKEIAQILTELKQREQKAQAAKAVHNL